MTSVAKNYQATDSGGGILLGSTSDRKPLLSACADVQRRAGSRVSIRSSRSRAEEGKLSGRGDTFSGRNGRFDRCCLEATYKANSSRRRRRYCFLGFMVLKRGSLMTSGQAAGQGLPQRRLRGERGGVRGAVTNRKERGPRTRL